MLILIMLLFLINSLGSFQWYDRVALKKSGGQFSSRIGCKWQWSVGMKKFIPKATKCKKHFEVTTFIFRAARF